MKAKHLIWIVSFLLLLGEAAKIPAQQTEADRKRFEEIKATAETGDPKAQHKLGYCYQYGKGVNKDATEALKWYRHAAEKGYAEAQNDLGACYYAGEIVTKNAAEAARWYRKAAEQGNAMAQSNLGGCYARGDGVPLDYVAAYKWLSLASAQGYERAKKNLASVEGQMTKERIAEAQRLAREFKPGKTSPPGASPLGQPSKP
jgi:TPR repeat protein